MGLANTKYWYTDNWYGIIKKFETLKEAKKSASKEDGVSIAIHTNNGKIIFQKCNGHICA